LVSVFRFGIGTDYFNYYNIFSYSPKNFSDVTPQRLIMTQIEPGFFIVCVFLKSLNFPFTFLTALCAFIPISLILYIIQKNSMQKTFSIFIFFANYYMVYIENLLRQGIAMGIFIYALYDFLQSKSSK
jgi:multisubunit Na+/H+ antiporter MnhC subunit